MTSAPARTALPPRRRRAVAAALTSAALTAATLAVAPLAATAASTPTPAPTASPGYDEPARLFVDWTSSTVEAAASLTGQARDDALLLGSFPSARWFTSGSPDEVRASVDDYVSRADAEDAVPVLVAYNLPYRDCAQYSAGGALDTASYNAWVDAFAEGIGDREAIVVVEPDGLGIIPWYTTVNGESEWCKPAEADPATAAASRFEQLNHAVDALAALPATRA